MTNQISTFNKLASQDSLIADFADELLGFDLPMTESKVEVMASDLANLMVKCAGELEDAGFSPDLADAVLADLESELG